MKRLENLPQIAARELGGLEATPTLLLKAKLAAAEQKTTRTRPVWQPVLATCAALVICVGAVSAVLLNRTPNTISEEATTADGMIASYSAGEAVHATELPRLSADVPDGSVSMSAGSRSAARTLFATGDGSSFPLVRVGGATYRLLTSPNGMSDSLLGDSLGAVSEFNVEPALGASSVVSNVVPVGESIYAISGMNGAMLAANVDGSLRVFQRVSYAGTAIIGSETLQDTLCGGAQAVGMSLSGVGDISDADTATALMQTLLDDSDYSGTSMSGSGSLQIELSNGLTLQLLVSEDAVSACGTWSCPDFFEAFHEAIGK